MLARRRISCAKGVVVTLPHTFKAVMPLLRLSLLFLSLLHLQAAPAAHWKERVPSCVHKPDALCDFMEAEPPLATARQRFQRELTEFSATCAAYLKEAEWEKVVREHASPAHVLVLDVRHGSWVGLADSLPRIMSLLRLGRSFGRDTYIWFDACADAHGPSRLVTTERSNGTECVFDPGEWFRTLGGVEWRWTGRRRRSVALKLGSKHGGVVQQETLFAFRCQERNEPGRCTHVQFLEEGGRVAWEKEGPWTEGRRPGAPWLPGGGVTELALDWLQARTEPWIRLELTNIDDFNNESRERLHFHEKCEIFYNMRPSPKLWRVLEHHLPPRVEEWQGMAVLFVRTGFADHVDLFMEAQAKRGNVRALREENTSATAVSAAAAAVALPSLDLEGLHALFQPCPLDAPRVTVVARRGAAPCVSYHSTATSPHFVPDARLAAQCGGPDAPAAEDRPIPPLEAYARCAAAAARGAAGLQGAPADAGWGVLVLSDSPAVKCAVSEILGRERVMFVPAPIGHVQYSAAHGVASATAADWYLAGLADVQIQLAPSWFFTMAHVRSFIPQPMPKHALLQFGFPQFFEAGNERELVMKGVVALNEEVMRVLAGTCPSELQLDESSAL